MKITIAGRYEAQKLIEEGNEYDGIVSISGSHDAPPGFVIGKKNLLTLQFDDVQSKFLIYEPPKPSDVKALIRWSEAIMEKNGSYLFHCEAGKSRSAAAAFIALYATTDPVLKLEAQNMAWVKAERDIATPHYGMVVEADKQLRRNGRMKACLGK